MKSKDIFSIIVLITISAVISIFVSNLLISSDENRSNKVEVVETVSNNLQRPPKEFFNENSVNPTRVIQIGAEDNKNLFGEQ